MYAMYTMHAVCTMYPIYTMYTLYAMYTMYIMYAIYTMYTMYAICTNVCNYSIHLYITVRHKFNCTISLMESALPLTKEISLAKHPPQRDIFE